MGNEHAKPSDRLKYIEREVNSVRSSIRSSKRNMPKEAKEEYVQNLVKLSTNASSLKGKVKQRHLEQTQRNISNTMNEILTQMPQESDLDMGAVETSSFIEVPVSKRQASKNSSERAAKKPRSQVDGAKRGPSTMQEIEEKFKTLEPQIDMAIENKDTTQLRVHQGTIKVLVTDLEMIEVPENTPTGDKKKKLDANITAQYQRIGRAMKDIKRNKDIDYLVKQTKKETALAELEEIQKGLIEAESLLNYSLKNNDTSTLKGIQENLVIINQRLSAVEAADEAIRTKKMQLTDKIMWFYQYINDSSKQGSQTDLSKAQMSYEDIVRNIAMGKNKDKDEIKVKLQSLQTFINNIKEDDENSLKRKQLLLNNVKQSFSFMLEDETKEKANSNSIPKKPDSGYKEVDSFYDTWKNIQKRIKSTTFPTDEVSKIDKILEDIQNSIAQTRQHITGSKSLQSTSSKKFNASAPNLSSPKSALPKFGSSLSVDGAGQSLIKTRAKVYNLTSEVHNINDQPVVLRNKKFYNVNNDIHDDYRFSKIEEIKTQVNYIKEKFEESQQKQHLKNKLESYVTILEGYIYHKNQAIANNAKLLLADIQDMLKNMSHIQEAMNNTNEKRLSIEESFENIAGIQEAVDKIQKSVNSPSKKDSHEHKRLKEELFYCKRCLEDTKIPPHYDMIQQQKEEILKKIKSLSVTLEGKHSAHDESMVKTREKLNNLKEKVGRFSGGYKGVLYNKIEKDLNKLLVDVSETVDDKDVADEIVKEAEKHLKILEHKATKDQSFRRTLNEGRSKNENEEKLAKLKSDLMDIKKAMDSTPTNGVNLFVGLRSRLDLVKLGLDQLKMTTEDEEKQREVLYNEVESLKNVVEAKIALARQSIRQWPLEQDRLKRDGEELLKIEEKFKSLKPEIENFVGTTSDNKFYELDEASIRLVLRMDKLQFSNGTENHTRKINLLKDIYNYGDLLDKRAKETEDIVEIERELYDIEKNFERYVRLNDLENLLDKISVLRKRLKNTETNRNLLARKQNCMKKVDALFNKATTTEIKTTEGVVLRRDSKDPANEISKIEDHFSNIKKEINSFAGIHADKKYYELEGSLTALFPKLDNVKVPEKTELHARKIKLLKEMHLHCDILDKKAKETELVREITKQLNAINLRVDEFKNTNEELKSMDAELRSVQTKLDKSKIGEDHKRPLKEKLDILLREYNRFKKAKEPRKDNYIGSSSFLADVQNLSKNKPPPIKQDGFQVELASVQREMEMLKGLVTAFVNSESSEEYKRIEDALLLLNLRLSKLIIPKNHELYKKQLQLEKSLQECLNMLDERAQEVDSLIDVERDLEKIGGRLEESISSEEKNAIDEKLIALQIKLGKLTVNEDLNQRKGSCTNKIRVYLKQLKESTSRDAQPNSEVDQTESVV